MLSKGNHYIDLSLIHECCTEADILYYYLGISEIPCFINSPLREDRRPSFGLYSPDGTKIYYTDKATGDRGSLFDLLMKLWKVSFEEVLTKIYNDIDRFNYTTVINECLLNKSHSHGFNSKIDLQCKIREWEDYDIEYWQSYGVPLEWLKWAEVYPISHKILIKNGDSTTFIADKYAYAFVEHKEGNVTLKIYQPFNKEGFKWSNKHDSSVISLWTKVPYRGDLIVICSSLKDALCLSANTNIPAIAVQGEGYHISNTAIEDLKSRYNKVCILFDSDTPGLLDGEKLAEQTGFTNVVLPFEGVKDISDYYKSLINKNNFRAEMLKLLTI